MNLEILFSAPLAVQLHVYAAMLAFIVGAIVLWRGKGTRQHKRWGKVWVVLMVLTALTSFFIHEIKLMGPFSPIHLISLGTMISLYLAVKQARQGDIENHKRSMKATFIGGMGIAGALAFTPGRLMYDVALAPMMSQFDQYSLPTTSLFDGYWQLPVLIFTLLGLTAFRRSIIKLFTKKL